MEFKKYGAYSILFVIVGGLLTYLPPMFSGVSFIFSAGTKFAEAKAQILSNTQRLEQHDGQIAESLKNTREFRSVWCIDKLSEHRVHPSVVTACTKWIKEP